MMRNSKMGNVYFTINNAQITFLSSFSPLAIASQLLNFKLLKPFNPTPI